MCLIKTTGLTQYYSRYNESTVDTVKLFSENRRKNRIIYIRFGFIW